MPNKTSMLPWSFLPQCWHDRSRRTGTCWKLSIRDILGCPFHHRSPIQALYQNLRCCNQTATDPSLKISPAQPAPQCIPDIRLDWNDPSVRPQTGFFRKQLIGKFKSGIDWVAHWLIDCLIHWLIGCLIGWWIDELIDWLIDGLMDLWDCLNDWWIDWFIDWLMDW